MSYDTWKTTEPERDMAPPIPHDCIDCDYRCAGGVKAWAHHQQEHHRMAVAGHEVSFACCPPRPKRAVA